MRRDRMSGERVEVSSVCFLLVDAFLEFILLKYEKRAPFRKDAYWSELFSKS